MRRVREGVSTVISSRMGHLFTSLSVSFMPIISLNIKKHRGRALHPTPEGVGFRAGFL